MRTSSTRARRRAAGLENISRVVYRDRPGWLVRFERTVDGERQLTSRYFSDAAHGGMRHALAAARAWRDQTARELPPSQQNVGRRKPIGHGYVKRVILKRRKGATPVFYGWLRIEDGRAAQTSYSILTNGVRGAKLLALNWLARERRALRHRLNGGKS